MKAAFLLLAAKPGRRLSKEQLDLTRQKKVSGLLFDPNDHLFWLSDDATVAFAGWQERNALPGNGSRWHLDENGLTMCCGHLRRRGTAWSPESEWAKELAAALRREPLTRVVADLEGVFTVAAIGRDGEAAVGTDALGLRFVYYGEANDLVAVSSRAALTAEALAPPGGRPARDPIGVGWLAHSRYIVGDRTGFEGVRVLPPASTLKVRSGATPSLTFERRPQPWELSNELRELSRDDLIDSVRADIAETLVSVPELPAAAHVVDITGGKDSRVVLAMLLASGEADRFAFRTVGPRDLPDVQIAVQLAAMFGLRHTVDFRPPSNPKSYGERLREFVIATAGMANAWDLRPARQPRSLVRVQGIPGEILRSYGPVRQALHSNHDLVRLFEKKARLSQLGLLLPDVQKQYETVALNALLDDPFEQSSPLDLLHSFHMRNRLRFSRFGPFEELNFEFRILPLYSTHALKVAFALGGEARQCELLHFEIIRRCSEQLARHPFAGKGWLEPLLADLPEASDYRGPGQQPTSGAHASASTSVAARTSESLVARLQRASFDHRRQALTEVLSDVANPAWELIDRAKTMTAFEQYASLGNVARQELFGAVTAALWLEGDA